VRLPYQLFIALRYLRSRKRHRSISFNTLISIGGVALGVTALIVVLSVMSGFHEDLKNKILGVNAHLLVLSYTGGIKDYEDVIEKIKDISEVKNVSPFVLGQVMLAKGRSAQGVYLRGVDPKYEARTTVLKERIKAGSFDTLKDWAEKPPLIIGSELAAILGVYLGDVVRVVSPVQEPGPFGIVPRIREFRVTGIFEIGMYEYDASLAITSLKAAQEFFRTAGAVTGIEVTLYDIYKADRVREEIPKVLGPGFYGRDWMQMNRNLFSALKLEKFTMFVILTLIILVASFNIVSTLIMNVIEKEREIAILKTMGATNTAVMGIFVFQGLIIGVTGTLIGVIGGYVLGYIINNYEIIKLPADVYYLSHLPVKMKIFDFVVVSLSAIVISLVATIYPALQAAKLNPVEPLRYE
jgi:lipoprotein-releasing system permease protein